MRERLAARRQFTVCLLAILALTSCGNGGSSADGSAGPATSAITSTPATTAPPDTDTPATASPTGDGAAEFVAVVRRELPELATDRSDAEIAGIAQTACDGLASGDDADTIVSRARSLGTLDAEATDQATGRELVKLAIDTVCLDQAPRVLEF